MDLFDFYTLGSAIVVIWVFFAFIKASGASVGAVFRQHRRQRYADDFGLTGLALPKNFGPLRIILALTAGALSFVALINGQLPQAIFFLVGALIIGNIFHDSARKSLGVVEMGLGLYIAIATMIALTACARRGWRSGDVGFALQSLEAVTETGASFAQGLFTGLVFGCLDLVTASGDATSPVFSPFSVLPDQECRRL